MRHLANWQGWRSTILHTSSVLLAFAITAFTYAQDGNNNVRAVRLSDVEGTVQLLDNNGVVFDQAHPNMPVTEGMRLKTGDDGRVEVQFEDGSVARVTPNSGISFDRLQRTSDGDTETQIQAASGLSYYEFNNRGGKYAVRFGPYTLTATKSSIFRVDVDQNPAQVAVMHGAVHVDTGNDGGIDVQSNQTATLDIKDASSYDVAQNVAEDSWDQWNSDRDSLLAQMGSKATMARASAGNPDDPGWSDLDYYGNWYDMPGYGMGWTPAGVGAGFDPFGSGYWGYYPAFGYTWISSYPWGWWPYHCGAWNWFNGPGWMWFPGNCGWGAFGRGWYPVTTVWRTPPNYVPPVRPKLPVRGPVHMPPQRAMIAVNRNPGTFQFRTVGGSKPAAPPIEFEGKSLHPVETSVHPRVAGPLGESFRTTSGLPVARSGAHVAPVPGGGHIGEGRTTYVPPAGGNMPREMPRNTVAPPPHFSAPPPVYHPAPSSGAIGGGVPRYSAPSAPAAPRMSAPPAPRMSAPAAPAGGARPH